jgi:hypothetical protein
MRRLRNTYAFISVTSAVVAITVQSWVYGHLAKQGVGVQPSLLINLLTAAGTYVFIYKVLVKAYELWGWRLIHRKYVIEGHWYHEFVSELKPGYHRFGSTEIAQTFDSVDISAQNYDPDFSRSSRTMWRSRAVQVDDNGWATVAFEAKRARPGAHDSFLTKEGLIYFQIQWDKKGKPVRLVGEYADSAPSDNRGSVTWVREAAWAAQFERTVHDGEVEANTGKEREVTG